MRSSFVVIIYAYLQVCFRRRNEARRREINGIYLGPVEASAEQNVWRYPSSFLLALLYPCGIHGIMWIVRNNLPFSTVLVNLLDNWTQDSFFGEEKTLNEDFSPSGCLWASVLGIFLIDGSCGRVQTTMGGAIPEQVILSGIGKGDEQMMGSKPVSSILSWPLHQFLLCFLLQFLLWFTLMMGTITYKIK